MNSFRAALFTRDAATFVWILLILATAVTWWVGAEHGIAARPAAATTLIVTAATKVWLIGDYFMEARALPRALHVAFYSWLAVTTLILAVMVNLT